MQKELPNYETSPYYNLCTNMVKLLVTERCNLSCPFCTKAPAVTSEISLDEIESICRSFVNAGMTRIKICGGAYGEPLVRGDILEIIKIARDAGFHHIGLATNGQNLNRQLVLQMIDAGLTWITHSITSLDPEKYKALYNAPLKDRSLEAVGSYNGLERYQVNAVLLKEHNAADWRTLVEFALTRGANVHFMELIGHEDNWEYYVKNFVSAEQIKKELLEKCEVYQYKRLDMTHVYRFQSGNVSVKQTTHEKDACSICRRIFVSSEGKVWFCKPENQLADFRTGAISTSELVDLMTNRYNEISQKGEDERLVSGCSRACDGCSAIMP